MMTQKTILSLIAEKINQVQSEENIQEQGDLIANQAKRQPIKHLLIGSPQLVTSTIHCLHLVGYAEVGDWSPFSPNPDNPEEVISILVRKITVQ